MALRRIIPTPNAKETALSFILEGNSNEVVRDNCQFIWDSRGLVDTASNNKVAIFGAKGKVVTPNNELLPFHLRHCLDFEPQPKYRLHSMVEERPGGSVREMDIRNQDIASGADETYFRRHVLYLTQQVKALGFERAMKVFLTRSGQMETMDTKSL